MSQDNAQKSSELVRKSLIVADAMYMIACDKYASCYDLTIYCLSSCGTNKEVL